MLDPSGFDLRKGSLVEGLALVLAAASLASPALAQQAAPPPTAIWSQLSGTACPGGISTTTCYYPSTASNPVPTSIQSGTVTAVFANGALVTLLPSSSAAAGVASTGNAGASKNFSTTAASLYGWSAANYGTAGAVIATDLAVLPTQGQAVSPKWCLPIPGSSGAGYGGLAGEYTTYPDPFLNGINLQISTGTSPCSTYGSVTGGYVSARVTEP